VRRYTVDTGSCSTISISSLTPLLLTSSFVNIDGSFTDDGWIAINGGKLVFRCGPACLRAWLFDIFLLTTCAHYLLILGHVNSYSYCKQKYERVLVLVPSKDREHTSGVFVVTSELRHYETVLKTS
jgi:hypothetical protein